MGHHHHNHITSSKNKSSTAPELPFEPVCDNANGNSWIYDANQVRYDQSSGLSKSTDLVGKHRSLAPPNKPDMNHNRHHHFDQTNDDISLYRQVLEVKNEEDLCYNNGLSGGPSLFHDAIESSRSFLDIRLSRPLTDTNPSFKPCFKALNLKEHQMASMIIKDKKNMKTKEETNQGGGGEVMATARLGTTNTGKKKRCDEVFHEVSKKVKCGGRSTLSPDKTYTASVLQEAITYIIFYQEQVKLLSTPYMKNSSIKDPWGAWDREDHNKRGPKHIDLKSRGLSLVHISCTPIAYRDNSATTTGALRIEVLCIVDYEHNQLV
ncbi:unnamed protein product [Brassica oleracea var. botrytis]